MLSFEAYKATVNIGSYVSLNNILQETDKPSREITSINIMANLNNKYCIALMNISTSGNFAGYGIDNSATGGYKYLTGEPILNGTVEYFV